MMRAAHKILQSTARQLPVFGAGVIAGYSAQKTLGNRKATIRNQSARTLHGPSFPQINSTQLPSYKPLKDKTISLLGCGNMGGALLKGWLAKGTLTPGKIFVNNRSEKAELAALRDEHGFNLSIGSQDRINTAEIALITIKPAQVEAALKQKPMKADCFISVAAGLPLAAYEDILGADQPIIRVMPNTPSAIGEGITAIIANKACKPHHIESAKELFEAVGDVIILDNENQMHPFTAISGSGPAYVFAIIAAFEKVCLNQGFSTQQAKTMAYKTVVGSAKYAQQSTKSPSELRIDVTSPGGTTQAGLQEFQGKNGIDLLMKKTIDAARDRSIEMGQENIKKSNSNKGE